MTFEQLLDTSYIFPVASGYRFIKDLPWKEVSALGSEIRPKYPTDQLWAIDTEKSGYVVVDVDMKNGKDGVSTLSALPDLPPTFAVKTRSGGFHYYFKGEGVNSAEKRLGPGIDTRGEGGLVFAYPDVISAAPITALPKWVADKIKPAEVDLFDLGDIPIEQDDPTYLAAAVELVRNYPPAIEGEGGDHHTLGLAMKLKDMGLSPEAALDVLLNHWNESCCPPWTDEELIRKINNAFKYGKKPAGAETLTVRMAESEELMRRAGLLEAPFEQPQLNAELPNLMDMATSEEVPDDDEGPIPVADLQCGAAPPMRWLVKNWIPYGGVSAFYGPPGGGKSLASVELGLCISNGKPWFGESVLEPSPVLYVSCEDDTNEFHRRLDHLRRKNLHAGDAGAEHNYHLWDRVGKISTLAVMTNVGLQRKEFLVQLERRIRALGDGHKVVILDTVSDMAEINENDRVHVNSFVKQILGGLSLRLNCTIIFLAHPSKSSDYSGSTAWQASVRMMLHLKYHEDDVDLRWITRGKTNKNQRHMGMTDGLLIRWTDGSFQPVDPMEVETELKAVDERAVFNVLRAHCDAGDPLTEATNSSRYFKNVDYINEKGCAVPADRLKNILNRLKEDGRVRFEKGKGLIAEDF